MIIGLPKAIMFNSSRALGSKDPKVSTEKGKTTRSLM